VKFSVSAVFVHCHFNVILQSISSSLLSSFISKFGITSPSSWSSSSSSCVSSNLPHIQLLFPLHSYYVLHYLSINSLPATGSSTVWCLALFNFGSLSMNPDLLLPFLPFNHSGLQDLDQTYQQLDMTAEWSSDHLLLYFKIS